jgi:16S rRNA (guanine1207-N2)-methyltransferase
MGFGEVMTEFSFDRLRRYPDLEAPNLFAVDASDRLILAAATDVASAAGGTVVVIGDHYGALTLGAAALGAVGIRVFQDLLVSELALASNAANDAAAATVTGAAAAAATGSDGSESFRNLPLGYELLVGAAVVLLQLPRSLAELDELAAAIARYANPSAVVYAGGRIKHMSIAMNTVLREHFGQLDVSSARQKSRLLIARSPLVSETRYPLREFHADLGLWVCAHGSAFAGTKIDIGTRLLLSVLDQAKPDADHAIDLGCGTGILAATLAKARPALTVLATDQSAGAVASAQATMDANGLAHRVTVVRDDGLSAQPEASADLILLNPPFHVGSTVHSGLADTLFVHAARVLRPGGELWTVYNSSLNYRPILQRTVGTTRQIARNAKFTVTASMR